MRSNLAKRLALRLVWASPLFCMAPDAQSGGAPFLFVKVGLLRQPRSRDTISLLNVPALHETLACAMIAAEDNNTTSAFLNQHFELVDAPLAQKQDPLPSHTKLEAEGIRLFIVDLPADCAAETG